MCPCLYVLVSSSVVQKKSFSCKCFFSLTRLDYVLCTVFGAFHNFPSLLVPQSQLVFNWVYVKKDEQVITFGFMKSLFNAASQLFWNRVGMRQLGFIKRQRLSVPVAPRGCPLEIRPPLGLITNLPPYVLSPLSISSPALPAEVLTHIRRSQNCSEWNLQ